MNCLLSGCTRVRREFSSYMFDLYERGNLETPQKISIQATFSPLPRDIVLGVKLFLSAWVLAIMAESIKNSEYSSFWLAYVTNWSFTLTCAYFVSSLFTAIWLAFRPFNDSVDKPGLIVKTTWALFSIVLPAEIVVCGLFWFLEFDGTLTYTTVMTHGGAIPLLVIDGFLIGRIPLRITQFFLSEFFCMFYLVWSIIHAELSLGNPYTDPGVDDDDSIYSSLKWKTNTNSCIVLSVVLLFVVNPLVFLLCWSISLIPPKRLVASAQIVELSLAEVNESASAQVMDNKQDEEVEDTTRTVSIF